LPTSKDKILVTGAAGFIGSHLTEALVTRAGHVRAFVQYNSRGARGWLDTFPKHVLDSIEIIAGDIRDPHGARNAVKGCNTVFHLAALIAIPYSYHSPDTYVDTNIKGTLNLLQAARDDDIHRFIHTSTSEVYGTARFVPITEEHPLQGQSPYSASKIGADHIAISFERSFSTPVTIVRPFNTYGPRQSARAIIPTIITQIASGVRQIKLGNLTPTRDFNFVGDIVSGFIAAADNDAAVGEVVNLGTGFEISIGDTAKMIANLMGRDLAIASDAERWRPDRSEVDRLCADANKARQLLNWQPKISGVDGLRAGLRQTIEWFTHPENLKQYRADSYNL
jgi:dTDP-glucose 4,6-dehydratase